MNEIAFRLGSLEVHWYGIFVAAGFLAGIWTAGVRGRRDGLNPETITDLGLWIFGGAFIGARILYVITFWSQEFAGQPLWKMVTVRSGFVFYGGLIGATLAGLGYAAWKRLPTWKLADALAPSIALGHALGRLGCLMTGCCYGKACTLPWAITFPYGHPAHPAAVHPVQVYESLLNFALFGGLAWLHRRRKFEGQVFATYLLAYAVVRTLTEMFRGDYPARQLTGWVTPAHWVSLLILAAGAGLYRWCGRHPKSAPPA